MNAGKIIMMWNEGALTQGEAVRMLFLQMSDEEAVNLPPPWDGRMRDYLREMPKSLLGWMAMRTFAMEVAQPTPEERAKQADNDHKRAEQLRRLLKV